MRLRLRDDFEHYAPRALKIRTKGAEIKPLTLNKAQAYVHGKLEEQKSRTGRVRALVLKGRQQGMSTYIAGRFYHLTTHRRGIRTFILTHEDAATSNLFDMVNRYHQNCPDVLRPSTGASNAKELLFEKLDSGYKIGTAGTKGVGRSSTVQLFHGSEAGYWPNAESHAAGIMQAVPDEPGTEIILESTANGVGNLFHQMWRAAEAGIGDYQAIFVPWFWQDEYKKIPPPDFVATEEELQYAALWGLDLQQIVWRRAKIAELRDADLFKQEYPACSTEAFLSSGQDNYITPPLIVKAHKTHFDEGNGPLVIGYDPAWTGGDRHAMAWRRGRKLIKVEFRRGLDTMQAAGWCRQVLEKERPAKMFVDVGGVGAGVYDRLKEMGFSRKVTAINFGSSPEDQPPEGGGALNRRAEMWMRSKEWLQDPAGADIPDDDALQADACSVGYTYDSRTRLQLESKDKLRARGVPSPDGWDAVALTFAEHVRPDADTDGPTRDYRSDAKIKSTASWLTA
jgi:hypothetical protein